MIDNSLFIESIAKKKHRIQKKYVSLCRFLNKCFPCRINKKGKPGKYTYVTICNKQGLDMVAASLYSLYQNSQLFPSRVVIVSDGSWEPPYGILYFSKRNLNVECLKWNECADYYSSILPELTTWAQKHIWGKKMAAILYISESDCVLFSDPDVLWYGTPLQDHEWDSVSFKVSIDNAHYYDKKYIEATNSGYLYDTENPINCGVVYLRGGLHMLNDTAIECIRYQADHCGDFAEQTVFAIMDKQYDSKWSREEIVSTIEDVINPLFSKPILYPNSIARHYLWRLKWIYWTEFLKMRMFPNK